MLDRCLAMVLGERPSDCICRPNSARSRLFSPLISSHAARYFSYSSISHRRLGFGGSSVLAAAVPPCHHNQIRPFDKGAFCRSGQKPAGGHDPVIRPQGGCGTADPQGAGPALLCSAGETQPGSAVRSHPLAAVQGLGRTSCFPTGWRLLSNTFGFLGLRLICKRECESDGPRPPDWRLFPPGGGAVAGRVASDGRFSRDFDIE